MQNIHRYFMYLAVIFIFILAYDACKAMWFTDAQGQNILALASARVVLW